MGKIKIRNIIDHSIVISEPDIRLRREILPNQTILIEEELLDEAMNFIGIANMFRRGYLRIENDLSESCSDTFDNLGISVDENKDFLSLDELKEVMENGSNLDLKKAIEKNTQERMSTIMAAAIASNGLSGSKIDLIEKYTGQNVLKLKDEQRQLSK